MEIESILHLWNLKGIANGVAAEEKKGNKRPQTEERLVPSILLLLFIFPQILTGAGRNRRMITIHLKSCIYCDNYFLD